MKPGLFQILIIVLIVVLLFGRGRISELLGDLGRGVKNFRSGVGNGMGGQGDEKIATGQSDLPIDGGMAKPAEDLAKSG